MHIRNGTPQDASALSQIARRSYVQYVDAIGREPAPMTADYARHLAEDIVLVISASDRIYGFAVLVQKGGQMWLETIAVDPDHAGRGIGTRLVHAAEAQAAKIADTLHLYTNAKMTQNLAWYPRLGYTQVTRKFDAGFERVFFKKALKSAM